MYLIAPVGAESQGAYRTPGDSLTHADRRKAAETAGFNENVLLPTDFSIIGPPAK